MQIKCNINLHAETVYQKCINYTLSIAEISDTVCLLYRIKSENHMTISILISKMFRCFQPDCTWHDRIRNKSETLRVSLLNC